MGSEASTLHVILEEASFVANIVLAGATTFGLLFIRQQVVELRKQRDEEERRSKAELAVDLIRSWASGMQRATYDAKRFVEERLLEEGCKSISEFKSFRVTEADARQELTDLLKLSFPNLETADIFENGDWLKREFVIHIRWLCVSYLNLLESILAAYRHKAADKKILFHEFRILYDENKGHPLAALRKKLPTDGYLAIEYFALDVKKYNEDILKDPGREPP